MAELTSHSTCTRGCNSSRPTHNTTPVHPGKLVIKLSHDCHMTSLYTSSMTVAYSPCLTTVLTLFFGGLTFHEMEARKKALFTFLQMPFSLQNLLK